MGAAASTGVAVAGGLLGLGQKQQEAKRQRQMLEKQDAAQRMQADLQLFGLLQQRQVDSLGDMVTDAAQKQAYLQTQASLSAQELQQKLNTTQATFAADVQRVGGEAEAKQKQMAAEGDRSSARLQAGAQAVEALVGASTEEQGVISSVLKQLQENGSNQNSIALLLDYAASAGGVNEAMQLLSGGTGNEATEAGANTKRAGQSKDKQVSLADQLANANFSMADIQKALVDSSTNVGLAGSNYGAANATNEANTAYAVNRAGIGAARVANEGNFGIMNSSNAVQRQSRYLNSIANEAALKQGTAINSEILATQQSNIRSPGFMDYVNLGVQGYGMYNGLKRGQ